jgi:FAD synthase
VSALNIVRDLDRPLYDDSKSVVTIGAFDGIHRGHVKILRELDMLARGIDGRGVVVTFEPHPLSVLRPDERPCLLTDPSEKAALIEGAGVDDLVIMEFTSELAGRV